MNNKKILFERMEYLNPDFKQKNENEQDIINDILSTNENINDWWNKFINYGKKGLLTTGIILTVALSTQAQQDNKTDDVIKTGIELASNNVVKNDVYNFIIGITVYLSKDYIKNKKIENYKTSSEIIEHYFNLREGKPVNQLSSEAKKLLDVLFKIYDINNSKMTMDFINRGAKITSYNYLN